MTLYATVSSDKHYCRQCGIVILPGEWIMLEQEDAVGSGKEFEHCREFYGEERCE